MLSEALSEYSALMVMEKQFGVAKLRFMLKHELDRYLHGRGKETIAEQPLALVEDQYYIQYNKGCLAMYALRENIGEQTMNRALSAFVRESAFTGPPYPTSVDLIRHFRAVTPDSLSYLLEDLFETITLYAIKAVGAESRQREDGRWEVELEVESRKFRANGLGEESEIEMDDWVDIGIFGPKADGEQTILFLEKRRIRGGRKTFSIIVDEEPERAGIDPYHKLIDRDSRDNVRKVNPSSFL